MCLLALQWGLLKRMETDAMKRLLITGGSGFVGGHLLTQGKTQRQVIATFCDHPFSFSGATVLPLNLEKPANIRSIVEQIHPDVIIHCAAWSDLDGCETNPDRAFRINAEATEILARVSAKQDCRLIYASTDMVFDGEQGDYRESDPSRPINVYGKSKLSGEEAIKAQCSNYVIARLALVYGRPVLGNNSFSEKILERVQRGDPMPLFTDQFRTPILVQNVARGLLELADSTFIGTVHLGGADKVDRYTFGLRLAEIKGFSQDLLRRALMSDVVTVAKRPRDVSLCISLAKSFLKTELLGYHEGLKEA